MFGIGMPELMLIFVLALLVFGPKELPNIARTIGKAMAQLRRASDELRDGIQREIDLAGQEDETPASPPEGVASTTVAEAMSPAPPEQISPTTTGVSTDVSTTMAEPVGEGAPVETTTLASESQAIPTMSEEAMTPSVASVPPETGEPKESPESPKELPPQAQTPPHPAAQSAETRNA